MDKPVKYALLIVLLSLLLGIVLLFPAVVGKLVVEPLAVVAWAIWRVVASVHQEVYWVGAMILCLAFLIRMLPPGGSAVHGPAYHLKPMPRDRVERWQVLFKDAALGDAEQAALRDALTELVTAAVSDGQQLAPSEVKERLETGTVPLPPAAYQYLFPAPNKDSGLASRFRHALLSGGPRWLRRWIHETADPKHRALNELLHWMEWNMEIKHDE